MTTGETGPPLHIDDLVSSSENETDCSGVANSNHRALAGVKIVNTPDRASRVALRCRQLDIYVAA
jgi:hypothetical protein